MASFDGVVSKDADQKFYDDLHFRKNRPDGPDIDFPPYVFRPYPTAMYSKVDGEIVTCLVGVEDTDDRGNVNPQLRERNDRAKAEKSANGWADHPDGIKDAQEIVRAAVRLAAAERAFDDQHLSDGARAELEAAEAEAEDHVLDVPAPKKKPGRPAKVS